ncbi:MAG TPA: GAF and ANTAR domain-containing protein [Nocardioidaceae bacterium]|nr:GAF and ANTAR domain-containing protein [Nocardioidaceae bacterium]
MSGSHTEARALHLAKELADSLDARRLDATLSALTQAAVRALPGVDEASITIRHVDGTIASYAMTSDFLEELDDSQYRNQEGPCYDGVTSNAFTVCGDLANDPRYPNYGPRAAEAGIRSQSGVRIFESRKSLGALNLYSRSQGALADIGFLAELFSQHARTAIAFAQEIDGLHEAMLSRQLVGQAVGILMERFQLPDDKAFAFLARVSQDRNVKLRVIAKEIIDLD